MAVEGLQRDAFCLLATTPETNAKIRARADMILTRKTPVPNRVGAEYSKHSNYSNYSNYSNNNSNNNNS